MVTAAMAIYCRFAQTRYASIITQTELVALRIRRLPWQPSHSEYLYAGVDFGSVPWGATTGLTVNLAIRALGCMGMNDAHREMEASVPRPRTALDSMARLTGRKHDAKARVYENVMSYLIRYNNQGTWEVTIDRRTFPIRCKGRGRFIMYKDAEHGVEMP